jgi:hypothetical protein
MFEEPKSLSLGSIIVFIEVQYDIGLLSLSMTFHLPTFVLILFVMMSNKDNDYILNLSPSAGGSSWILAICALRIMKTGLGHGSIFII